MKIKPKQYARALFELTKDKNKTEVKETIANFTKFLFKNNDAFKLDKILQEFTILCNKELLILDAEISSAHQLSRETEELLKEYLKKESTAKEIKTDLKVNKNILGGVIIKYGDKIFDASIKNRLNKLKQSLLS